MKNNLHIHLKLYDRPDKQKFFIKVVLENGYAHPKNKFSSVNETLNQLCLFQTEIKVSGNALVPFNDYKAHLYKSDEDQMLDYLYREKKAYGIGHNTACTWENCANDDPTSTHTWVSTTFLPTFDVKSQSTRA